MIVGIADSPLALTIPKGPPVPPPSGTDEWDFSQTANSMYLAFILQTELLA